MANSCSLISLSFMTFFSIFFLLCTRVMYTNGCYTSIFSFGDSLADTGNLKQLSYGTDRQSLHFFYPPYGETFFHMPTGRCSNGRLIIDFVAESLGLPLVQPFVRAKGRNMMELQRGVNFAVAGATALDSSFLGAKGVHNPMTNSSLKVQLGWFKQSFPSLCDTIQDTADCKRIIDGSLVIMGEIGGNDYNHAILAGKSLDEVETYVPLVIEAVISAVNELIELGAKTLVIPGNLPIGCLAVYLSKYYGSDNVEYDNSTGCITQLNKLSEYHNEFLKIELSQMQESYPEVHLIYADYYNAAMQIYRSPNKYGFTNGALKTCCGGGGPFNYNASAPCADLSSTTCMQPHTYANWDGLHLTEAAYKVVAESVFQGPYSIPQFNSVCPTTIKQETDHISSST